MKENTLRGNQLAPAVRAQVLNQFIYRCTVENNQRNPRAVAQVGTRLPFITDDQWLAVTDFYVNADGTLDARFGNCETHNYEIPEHRVILEAWQAKVQVHGMAAFSPKLAPPLARK